jgi:cytochrome P450
MAEVTEPAESSAPPLTFNPFAPELDVDPHPTLHALRAGCPVHHEPALGMYIVTGYDEGKQVFRNSDGDHRYVDFQKQRQGPGVENEPYCQGMSKWVLMQEGADHRRQRATVSRHFTQARVERLYPQMVEMAHDLIDGFAEQGTVEIVEAYGNALPLAIISALLGVPDEDQPRIEHWMEGFKRAVQFLPMNAEELADTNAAITGLGEYFTGLLAERRAHPGSDLLTALITEADAGELSDEELVVNAWGLYAAGHETSGNAICDGLVALLKHPDQLELLIGDRSLLDGAVDEMLRWDGPGQGTHRIFTHEIEIAGQVIPPNSPVVVYMSGANRDPARWEDPDRFDIRRPDARNHLGFADGHHKCAGQHLARATIGVAVRALLERLENLRVIGEIEWNSRTVFHGPHRMTLGWDSVRPRPAAS